VVFRTRSAGKQRVLIRALSEELFDQRVSLHGIDAEVLAEAARADSRPLSREFVRQTADSTSANQQNGPEETSGPFIGGAA
jgi:hypothetical protein